MTTDTYCGNCGEPIYGEDSANRQPCPKCGSKKRKYSLELNASVSVSATVTAQVFRPASAFLDVAHTLANSDDRMDWNLCVVAALVACEVSTEKTLVEVARATQKESLVKSQRDSDRTFKMQNPKTRALYKRLTGDDIESPPEEWDEYVRVKNLRNGIVHEGQQADQKSARDCLRVATRFVKRLESHKPAK